MHLKSRRKKLRLYHGDSTDPARKPPNVHTREWRHGLRHLFLQQLHLQAQEDDEPHYHQEPQEDQPCPNETTIHTIEEENEDNLQEIINKIKKDNFKLKDIKLTPADYKLLAEDINLKKETRSKWEDQLCRPESYFLIPLTPMGVLAPGSAHARPSAQPPI